MCISDQGRGLVAPLTKSPAYSGLAIKRPNDKHDRLPVCAYGERDKTSLEFLP